jgi:hypothetical protein
MKRERGKAGKPWLYEDDSFLVAYYGAMGDFIGTHDLGREPGEADKRVAFLKETGAWQLIAKRERALNRAYAKAFEAEIEYAKLVGWKLKAKDYDEHEGKTFYCGERPWREDPECEA